MKWYRAAHRGPTSGSKVRKAVEFGATIGHNGGWLSREYSKPPAGVDFMSKVLRKTVQDITFPMPPSGYVPARNKTSYNTSPRPPIWQQYKSVPLKFSDLASPIVTGTSCWTKECSTQPIFSSMAVNVHPSSDIATPPPLRRKHSATSASDVLCASIPTSSTASPLCCWLSHQPETQEKLGPAVERAPSSQTAAPPALDDRHGNFWTTASGSSFAAASSRLGGGKVIFLRTYTAPTHTYTCSKKFADAYAQALKP